MENIGLQEISGYSCDQLCDYLRKSAVDENVVVALREQNLSGLDFVELTDDEIKEIFPLLGTRKPAMRCVAPFRKVSRDRS